MQNIRLVGFALLSLITLVLISFIYKVDYNKHNSPLSIKKFSKQKIKDSMQKTIIAWIGNIIMLGTELFINYYLLYQFINKFYEFSKTKQSIATRENPDSKQIVSNKTKLLFLMVLHFILVVIIFSIIIIKLFFRNKKALFIRLFNTIEDNNVVSFLQKDYQRLEKDNLIILQF